MNRSGRGTRGRRGRAWCLGALLAVQAGCGRGTRDVVAFGAPFGGAMGSTPIAWPINGSREKKLATINAVGAEHASHFRVSFGQTDPGVFDVLCGAEAQSDTPAGFYLTPKNAAQGQPNPKAPEAPGLRHTQGWSFITFTWPLIWVRNIDAGSIGTTAIERWHGDEVWFYLVRNGKSSPPSSPVQPSVADDASALYFHVGHGYDSFQLGVPSGKEIARVRFYKQQGYGDRMLPVGSAVGGVFAWEVVSFDVLFDGATQKYSVTSAQGSASEHAYLEDVLARAHAEGIYRAPASP